MATYHCSIKKAQPGYARKHAEYIMREGKYSAEASGREDLVYKETFNLPEWTNNQALEFWKAADEYERANGIVYFEFEIALPNELSNIENVSLAKEFARETIGDSKVYTIAIHNKPAELNPEVMQPHAHIIFSEKIIDKKIKYSKEQFFKRYNAKNKDKGGCKKDDRFTGKAGVGPANIIKVRKQCESIINQHLENKNLGIKVSADSLKSQYEKAIMNKEIEKAKALKRDPEPHLGPKLIKNEKEKSKKYEDKYAYFVKFATEKMCRAYLLREMKVAREEFLALQKSIEEINGIRQKNENIISSISQTISTEKVVGRELTQLITQHLKELNKDRYFFVGRRAYYQKCVSSKERAVSYAQSIYTRGETLRLTEEYKNILRIEEKYNQAMTEFQQRTIPCIWDVVAKNDYQNEKQRLENWGRELAERKEVNARKIELMKEVLAQPAAAKKIKQLVEGAAKKFPIWQQKIEFYDQNITIIDQQIKYLKDLRSDINHTYYQNRVLDIDKNYIDHLKNGKSSKGITRIQRDNFNKIKCLIGQVKGIMSKLEKNAKGGINPRFKLDRSYEDDNEDER